MKRKLLRMDHAHPQHKKELYVQWVVDSTIFNGTNRDDSYRELISFCDLLIAHYVKKQLKDMVVEFYGPWVAFDGLVMMVTDYLRKNGVKVGIVPDGTCDVTFLKNILEKVDTLTLQFDPSTCSKDQFNLMISHLYGNKLSCVQIPINLEVFETSVSMTNHILNFFPNLLCTIVPYHKGFTSVMEYSAYQKELLCRLSTYCKERYLTLSANSPRGLMINSYDDDTFSNQTPFDFYLENWAAWDGILCWQGIEKLIINEKGDVFGAWCCQNWFGNICNGRLVLPEYPVFCERDFCFYCSDFAISRYRYMEF